MAHRRDMAGIRKYIGVAGHHQHQRQQTKWANNKAALAANRRHRLKLMKPT